MTSVLIQIERLAIFSLVFFLPGYLLLRLIPVKLLSKLEGIIFSFPISLTLITLLLFALNTIFGIPIENMLVLVISTLIILTEVIIILLKKFIRRIPYSKR